MKSQTLVKPTRTDRVLTALPYLLLFAFALLSMLVPAGAFAQGNPLTDEGAKSGAIAILESTVFWLWILFGAGLVFWAVAYFTQGIMPELYNTVRSWIKTAVLIMFIVPAVITFIVSQANSATGS
jgi:hypothetical protein